MNKNDCGVLWGAGRGGSGVGRTTGRVAASGSEFERLVLRELEQFSNGERLDLHVRECSRTTRTRLVRIVHPVYLRENSTFGLRSFAHDPARTCSRLSRTCGVRFEDESIFQGEKSVELCLCHVVLCVTISLVALFCFVRCLCAVFGMLDVPVVTCVTTS